MLAILAVVAFIIAAILCFIPGVTVSVITVIGIIAIGLALLTLHNLWPLKMP